MVLVGGFLLGKNKIKFPVPNFLFTKFPLIFLSREFSHANTNIRRKFVMISKLEGNGEYVSKFKDTSLQWGKGGRGLKIFLEFIA